MKMGGVSLGSRARVSRLSSTVHPEGLKPTSCPFKGFYRLGLDPGTTLQVYPVNAAARHLDGILGPCLLSCFSPVSVLESLPPRASVQA